MRTTSPAPSAWSALAIRPAPFALPPPFVLPLRFRPLTPPPGLRVGR
jgi:hypothetical protein